MIRREQTQIIIICDGCDAKHDTKMPDRIPGSGKFNWRKTNYSARWTEAQADGWTAQRMKTEASWQHFCSQCK